MSQSKKGRLNYRCPACFMREIDMDMFYDEEKDEYYCLRCGYHGDEDDVLRLNEQARYRYKMINKRVEDQAIGRSGRQGQPGTCNIYMSEN